MSVLTREYIRKLIESEKEILDSLRDYDLGRWRPGPSDLLLFGNEKRSKERKKNKKR